MPRYCFRMEFDGGPFCGWQLQSAQSESRQASVQGTVEEALKQVLHSSERIPVTGCGRTDAGVHAKEYYAHFDVDQELDLAALEKLRHGMNGILLDRPLVMTHLYSVANEFHAQKSVVAKTYEYQILFRRSRPTIHRNYAYWVARLWSDLNHEALLEAMRLCEGRHDFIAFAAADFSAQTSVRTINRVELLTQTLGSRGLEEDGVLVTFRFQGEGFLKHMLRNLSGTLLEVALDKRKISNFKDLLSGRSSRSDAGLCLPPEGLCLYRVDYEAGVFSRDSD